MQADWLLYNASQVVTVAGGGRPKRGPEMRDLGLITEGAVAIRDGKIIAVGPDDEVRASVQADLALDAGGCVVMPGFVDPHTHLLWAGSREDEFEMRLQGATYMEIMRAGGGIMNTVQQVRAANVQRLVAESRPRLDRMLAYGTTTAEAKSGYGLSTEDELKSLRAIAQLDKGHPVELTPTFLGAHAIPAEYAGRADEFVELVVGDMLPAVAAHYAGRTLPFCDVFCEEGAFSLAQSRRILLAAREMGFPLKIHVDEFEALGGTRLAVELGAVSADHIVCTPPDEIELLARSDTVAVSLPGTPFGLAEAHYSPARAIIDAGGILALATDLNPGTSYCESMPFIIALACRTMRLWPAEAIVAATLNAAYAIGRGDVVGSIEAGKQADLIVLDMPDYRQLPYRFGTNPVRTVIKRGEVVAHHLWAE